MRANGTVPHAFFDVSPDRPADASLDPDSVMRSALARRRWRLRAASVVEGRGARPADPTMAIQAPLLLRLLEDWETRRRGRTMPARADFDPFDLKYMLGKLLLVDVLRDPLRFRFRLIGTELLKRSGIDLTGRMLDDHPDPEYREYMRQRYITAVAGRQPLSSIQTRLVLDGRLRRYEALLLPLASDGETVDMLMIGIVHL
jgi:hypothetical protein